MADDKRIIEFLRSPIGKLGISSLVLVVLEKMMDTSFVCPCQPGYNEGICACYAIVPFFACFAFTFRFVDPRPRDRGMENNSTCNKLLFFALIAFIWLFLFFFDGRYVACACSHWEGEYTETAIMKWCKPTGNDTLVLEREQETQRCITLSQFAGFAILLVITILGISYCCKRFCCPDCCHGCACCCEHILQKDVPLNNVNSGGTTGGEAVTAQ